MRSTEAFSGFNTFEIEFVTISDPGNLADTTGNPNPAGSVPYTFRMGMFEVSRRMIEDANRAGGLGITLAETEDVTVHVPEFPGFGSDNPATGVSWFELKGAVRSCRVASTCIGTSVLV